MNDFIKTVKTFEDFINPIKLEPQKDNFVDQLLLFLDDYDHKEQYENCPFLHFAIYFCKTLLNIIAFEEDVMIFMLKSLRLFYKELLVKTPLEDKKTWEKQRNTCYGFIITILKKQYGDEKEILITLHKLIENYYLKAINPKRIHDTIMTTAQPLKSKFSAQQYVNAFVNLINIKWTLDFDPKSFSIDWYYIDITFENEEKTKVFLEKIQKNKTIISTSSLYYATNEKNSRIIGVLNTPTDFTNDIRQFLTDKEQEGSMTINDYTKIINFKKITSYINYVPGQGWTSSQKKIERFLQTNKELPTDNVFSTKPWNKTKITVEQTDRLTLVTLLENYQKKLSYSDLNTITKTTTYVREKKSLFGHNTPLLQQLEEKKIVTLSLTPTTLLDNFSTKIYLTIPNQKKTNNQTERIIKLLPHSLVYDTEDNNKKIICPLDDQLTQLLSEKLHWTVIPIKKANTPLDVSTEMFNEMTNYWKNIDLD